MTNKVIVALDNKNLKEIIAIVKKTKSEVFGFKIGKEFFLSTIPCICESVLNKMLRFILNFISKHMIKRIKNL